MLRKIRIGISLLFFVLITFYFIDFAGLLPDGMHVLAHMQFVPALLSLQIGILVFLFFLTFVLGRVYCSSICPMGVFQDIMSRIGKKKKYTYHPAKTLLRWSVLAAVLAAALLGFPLLLTLLDPYSAYGRVAVQVFKPVYMAGNNMLAWICMHFDNYNFYYVDMAVRTLAALLIGIFTFLLIGFLGWKYGRIWCNTVCPVGTVLGFISRYSLFKIDINKPACNGCGKCGRNCKASCLDTKNHVIDHSRCVMCFDCIENCSQHAIRFAGKAKKGMNIKKGTEPVDKSKRRFLATTAVAVMATPLSITEKAEAAVNKNKPYTLKYPIAPPGAKSIQHLSRHCTGCQLCVTRCPSHVLKPAFLEYGLGGMMQPLMSFEKEFCNFDCTVCSDVCPNGAIKPLTIEEKHETQVGRVVFIKDNCIVYTDATSCGACSEHCPTQAVSMIPYKDGLTIPSVNPDICVGCGGCEYVCPVRPFRAIHVEGNEIQKKAEPFKETEGQNVEIDDFGF